MSCPEVLSSAPFARMPFREAAPIWLESRKGQISPRTLSDYAYWITYLGKFFGDIALNQIHVGHIEAYQRDRAVAAGPVCINHEIGVLCQILKRAELWATIEPHYHPLRIPRSSRGRALEDDEKERLFKMAASRPRWKVAYCCILISDNTTAGPGEIRNLRMRDVILSGDCPHIQIVEGTKNEHRVRHIPLNANCLWAVRELYKRAQSLGSIEPDHYLLPHRAHPGYLDGTKPDPTMPAGSWRRAWENLRAAAGMDSTRLYDFRHNAITTLLEDSNVSERTVQEIAGHVSKQMMNRYSHTRMRTKKEAVDALVRPMETLQSKPQFILLKGGRKAI